MALERGTKLGPYQIESPIGAGGMGEVYKATDTRLERTVAIKVLPAHVASDPERKARFEREAKTVAALSHPHICPVFDVGREGETDFLVMEYLEGETLAERLQKGPLPLDQALRYAIEIADALDKAHRQGVTHRDLKPANIMLTKAGAKLLDFGLAKLTPTGPQSEASTKLADALTEQGTILGTFQYMAPEQLEGGEADHRTDIWAFGCVVYEMVTGQKAFEGKTRASLIGAILKDEPRAMSSLQPMSPPALDQIIRICLAKDREERWQGAGDIGRLVKLTTDAGATQAAVAAPATVAQPALWQHPSVIAAIVLVTAVVVALTVRTLTRPALAPITRLSIVFPQTQVRTSTGRRGVAISPTGSHVVYVANQQLYLRALDELEAQPLAGTEGSAPSIPFFSPNGQWIGFHSNTDGALKKVALSGGAAVTLANSSGPSGASWGADDTIVFGQGPQGILRVAGAGGTPDVLVSIDPPHLAHQPQILPGGEAVLYTLGKGPGGWDAAQIVVELLATGERTVVVERGSDARYLPTGHLVYALGRTLLAVPFDVEQFEVTGGPVPLVEGVSRAARTGAANADIARTGALVYLPDEGGGGPVRTLVWVDRDGTEEALATPPRGYVYPRLSPDGTKVALDARDREDDVWIWDLTRETPTRLTFSAQSDQYPVWTPDGQQVVFGSSRNGSVMNLYWRAADGTGTVERLTESPNDQYPHSLSPDGTRLVFREDAPDTRSDLYVLTLDNDRRVEPLIMTEFREVNAEISPDGRWLAYESNASGQYEIYVQPFPDVDAGRWQMSTTGGSRPLWGQDGRELFYLTEAGVMGVTVETGAGFAAGTPRLVVERPYFGMQAAFPGHTADFAGRTYDISPDGQRFLMLKDSNDAGTNQNEIVVVLNWFTELERLVPTP